MSKFIQHIKPPSGFSLGLKELWQYRELFYFFTWRDIKVKYKQTYLGIIWALLQPLGMMVIFTFLFSKTLKIDSGNVAYPLFVLSGLILWNLFSSSVSHAGESMIQNSNIIKKIYFPRLIIPGSAILVAFFDFIMGLLIFVVLCIIYKQSISWQAVLYFPAGIIIVLLAAFGIGTFLAALNVKFRDFRYTIPFLLQVLFFASQIIYPLFSIQQQWLKYLLAINPMNAAIELFRSPLSGTSPDFAVIGIGVLSTLLFFAMGIFYFRKTESYFADLS
ncbi:MAG: ABC transporter permease [Chitinophagaceae bacterium]|nr:ABC transporter permease [Chitinophagaceae bacterium]MBP6477022.1 ABC transporter permease [Chitinophagaceae bacterium]MBP7108824.1 ABC transporter permease [Chitinophagaceae bacterium]HQX95574.1 ABC transporter permease [Chitinophagaceae bacterium]HQZ49132.1 ABC transporter permease [Chitinophagaceae bacterium]